MTDKYSPSVGDKVKVVIKGVVTAVYPETFYIGDQGIDADLDQVQSVELIVPPVVTFFPGQTVRSKFTGGFYSLGYNGYFSHTERAYYTDTATFTSADYEPVSL